MQGAKGGQHGVQTAAWKTSLLVCACLILNLVVQAQQAPPRPAQSHPTSAKEDGSPLGQLLDRARKADSAGRIAEAEQLYLSALAEAEKLGDSSPTLANVLRDVARMYGRKSEAEKAVGFSKRALAIDEAAPSPVPGRVGEDLSVLVGLYEWQNPEEAERYVQRLVELVENSPQLSAPNRSHFLASAADFYRRQGRNVEAEALLNRALQIDKNGPRHAQFRAELASLYASEGKQEDAEKILRDTVAADKAADGKGAKDRAAPSDLMTLARQYKEEGKLQESEECYNRAIALLEPDPKGVSGLTYAFEELGEVYHAEHRDAEAENVFLRAINAWEQSTLSLHPDIIRRSSFPSGLLQLYRDQGRLSEMEPIYQRELTTLERVFGPNDNGIIQGLMSLVYLYQEEGKNAQAVPPYRRAIELTEKSRGADDPQLRGLLTNYAILLDEVGEKEEAARVRARIAQTWPPKPAQNQKN